MCGILRGWPVGSILIVCSCWNQEWRFGTPGGNRGHCHCLPVAVRCKGIFQARGKKWGLAENYFSLPSRKTPVTRAFSFRISFVLSLLARTFQCHLCFSDFLFSGLSFQTWIISLSNLCQHAAEVHQIAPLLVLDVNLPAYEIYTADGTIQHYLALPHLRPSSRWR